MIVVFDSNGVQSAHFLHYLWVMNKYIVNKCEFTHLVWSPYVFVFQFEGDQHHFLLHFNIQMKFFGADKLNFEANFRILL